MAAERPLLFYGGLVEQRRWGFVLIAVALLGIFVTANLRPRAIDGAAVAEPVPGPPQIGDCVLDPVPDMRRTPIGDQDDSPIRPTLRYGVCNGPRYGEVARVSSTDPDSDATGTEPFDREAIRTVRNRCRAEGQSFIGAPPGGTHLTELYWRPAVAVGVRLLGPDERQYVTGQRWAACIILPRHASADELTEPYEGSLRNALTTGSERDRLGLCLADVSSRELMPTCGEPHRVQVIATGASGGTATTREVLRAGCLTRVEQWAGSRVAGEPGLLVSLVVTDDAGAERDDRLFPPNSNVVCLVEATGDRTLVGSILGLGDDPIPWG